jgi:hypothetical protein
LWLTLPTDVEIESTTAATLTREEGFEQTGERGEISSLNQYLTRS